MIKWGSCIHVVLNLSGLGYKWYLFAKLLFHYKTTLTVALTVHVGLRGTEYILQRYNSNFSIWYLLVPITLIILFVNIQPDTSLLFDSLWCIWRLRKAATGEVILTQSWLLDMWLKTGWDASLPITARFFIIT